MSYPPQGPFDPYQQQQGYPGYPPQGYPPQGGYQPPPQQPAWGQQQGAQFGGPEYNFATLYGQADHSAGTLLEGGKYLARPEFAEWGRTKDGTKGQWTVRFRTTTGKDKNPSGPGNGAKLTTGITVSPKKNDGQDNNAGLGIMFRQLAALGIPVGPPHDQGRGFWELGVSEQQVAQMIVQNAREVELTVTQSEWPEGSGQYNNKISRIDPGPMQGAPPAGPFPGGPGMAGPPAGYAPQAPAPGPGMMPPSYPQQPAQPVGGYPPQPGPVAPQPWQPPQQAAPPQQGPFPGQPGGAGAPQMGPGGGQPSIPGAPPWAQPPVPGQPGLGQFTAEGQGTQPGTVPGHGYPPQNGMPGQPQQAGPGDQPPPMPPWATQ